MVVHVVSPCRADKRGPTCRDPQLCIAEAGAPRTRFDGVHVQVFLPAGAVAVAAPAGAGDAAGVAVAAVPLVRLKARRGWRVSWLSPAMLAGQQVACRAALTQALAPPPSTLSMTLGVPVPRPAMPLPRAFRLASGPRAATTCAALVRMVLKMRSRGCTSIYGRGR